MTSLLRDRPAATPEMLAVFGDAATIAHALRFEAALARALAAEGLVGAEAADEVARACDTLEIDPAALAEEAAFAGTLAIPLVRRLKAALRSEAAIAAAHRGGTSQDLADTVLMLQARAGAALLAADVERLRVALFALAARHAATPAIGRTLLQDALPVAFGLRLAQAGAGVAQAGARLRDDVAAHAVLQFGGAAGARAGLAGKGAAVGRRIADALELPFAEPWQARRIGVAAIAASLATLIGAAAKFARDVSLLAQNAVGETREPAAAGRGGSSAMAHKRNPTGCQIALSAAIRAPGLVAGVLAGLPQEEERGLGGWQAEAPALAELFCLAAAALAAMATVAEGLEVDEARIAANLSAATDDRDIGESAAIIAALARTHEEE